MSTIYLSQLSTLPLMEGDQDQGHFPTFHAAKDPPVLFPFMISSSVEHQGQSYGDGQHLRQQVLAESNQQFSDHMVMGGSGMAAFPTPATFRPTIQSIGGDMIQRSSYDPYDIESVVVKRVGVGSRSGSKWTTASSTTPPAKMRIVRKATNDAGDGVPARKPRRRGQAVQQAAGNEISQQQAAMGVLRVCSDCNTSKTPLWRSGPRGPKSLCNACGIRQRKARRAMAAAVAAGDGGVAGAGATVSGGPQAVKPAPGKKERSRTDVDRSLPFKKRCKMAADHANTAIAPPPPPAAAAGPAAAAPPPAVASSSTAAKADAAKEREEDDDRVAEDDVAAMAAAVAAPSPSKASPAPTFFHGFPRDEITDAAMLLMTLSCGLVRS